jgi:hypothetical protein
MLKRLFFLSFMIGAVGVPYLLSSSSEWWGSFKGRFTASGDPKNQAAGTSVATSPQVSGALAGMPASALASPRKAQSIEGSAVQNLAEVLHFDATPGWVMARWPRVTAGLAELELQGYRVPLVTGTAENDLAGSLTYYFDKEQRVKFITFHGATGDPRKLVALVMQKYSFRPEPTKDPSLSLYLVKWNGKPMSELRIRTASVVRADQPHARYQVDLAMKRP